MLPISWQRFSGSKEQGHPLSPHHLQSLSLLWLWGYGLSSKGIGSDQMHWIRSKSPPHQKSPNPTNNPSPSLRDRVQQMLTSKSNYTRSSSMLSSPSFREGIAARRRRRWCIGGERRGSARGRWGSERRSELDTGGVSLYRNVPTAPVGLAVNGRYTHIVAPLATRTVSHVKTC